MSPEAAPAAHAALAQHQEPLAAAQADPAEAGGETEVWPKNVGVDQILVAIVLETPVVFGICKRFGGNLGGILVRFDDQVDNTSCISVTKSKCCASQASVNFTSSSTLKL